MLCASVSHECVAADLPDWLEVTNGNGDLSYSAGGSLGFHHLGIAEKIEASINSHNTVVNTGCYLRFTTYSNAYSNFITELNIKDHSLVVTSNGDYAINSSGVANGSTNSTTLKGEDGSKLILKNQTTATGIYVQANSSLALEGIEEIDIYDARDGIKLFNKEPNYGTKVTLSIDNARSLLISNSDMDDRTAIRRGIISSGDNKLDIKTSDSITIDTIGLQTNNEKDWSGLITGNGDIDLQSKTITLKGFSALSDKGYMANYGIAAMADMPCDICTTERAKFDSDITLKASTITLETNWGGMFAESNGQYYAKINLKSDDNISILAAGNHSSTEPDEIGLGVYSAVKAISGGKEASIAIEGKNVSIDYNSQGDLENNEENHDLLFASGQSAKIEVNGEWLMLNQHENGKESATSANIRNVAFADKSSTIQINQDKGVARVVGDLTARDSGEISLTLREGSLFQGGVMDNGYAYYDFTANSIDYFANKGTISITGEAGGRWEVSPYQNGGDLFSKSSIAELYSTLSNLIIEESATKTDSFTVDLTKYEKGTQRLMVNSLSGLGFADFNLRFNTTVGTSNDTTVATHQTDQVVIHEVDGTPVHGIRIVYDGPHDGSFADELKEAWLVTDDSKNAKFELTNDGGKVDIGLYKYELTHDERDSLLGDGTQANYWYLKKSNSGGGGDLTPGGDTGISLAGSHRFLHWNTIEDLRKRLGEVRYGAQDGGWVRLTAQNDRADGVAGAGGIEQDYYGINVGFDRLASVSEDRMWLLGGSLVYGNAEQETRKSGNGSGETDRYGFNLYATWAKANGLYADFVLSADWFEQEVTTHANDVAQKGDYDTWGVGLSVEVGKMFTTEDHDYSWGPWYRHWWFEPQLQLAYYYLNGADYRLSDRGIRVEIDDDDSLIGRAGVVFGTKWNMGEDYEEIDRRYAQLMFKIGAKHDFLGDYRISMNGQRFTKDIGSTTFYYGLGFDWQFNDRTRLYLQAEREEGGGYTKEYEVSAGMKVEF